MALLGPPPMLDVNPLAVMFRTSAKSARRASPSRPGETSFSMHRTRAFADEPLPLLVEAYERYGPIFTTRLFHSNVVWMLGPEANHYITLSHASNFEWRDGHFRDLIGLMGDGLLTIDGEFHRRSRLIMLPAFHREHIMASVQTVLDETDAAIARLEPGAEIDLYVWTRHLAMRIAMRALFGLDPDGRAARAIDAAGLFEEALSFYSSDYLLRVFRGRRSPWGRMQHAARRLDELIYTDIAERRRDGRRGSDIISLLLDAEDDEGNSLSDLQIRDEVMTLLFAGHDTSTSTISFMFYELARHPAIVARLTAEQDALADPGRPTPTQLVSGELKELEMVVDETLRKYPPAWVGPRRGPRALRVRRRDGARAGIRQLLLLGLPPPSRRVCRTRGLPPRAVHGRGQGGAAQGRLRAVRRRLADVHRDALRPARGACDRIAAARPLLAGAARHVPAEDSPDADDQPARGAADDRRPSAKPAVAELAAAA